jgi:hypothetical protein
MSSKRPAQGRPILVEWKVVPDTHAEQKILSAFGLLLGEYVSSPGKFDRVKGVAEDKVTSLLKIHPPHAEFQPK